MQVAPIRSPIDMLRAQSRLKALGFCAPGSADEIESDALRNAIEHYRCVTEAPDTAPPKWWRYLPAERSA